MVWESSVRCRAESAIAEPIKWLALDHGNADATDSVVRKGRSRRPSSNTMTEANPGVRSQTKPGKENRVAAKGKNTAKAYISVFRLWMPLAPSGRLPCFSSICGGPSASAHRTSKVCSPSWKGQS